MRREADIRQRTGEGKPMKQSEAEGDEPGIASRQTGVPAPGPYQFDSDEHDTQRDQGFDQRDIELDIA